MLPSFFKGGDFIQNMERIVLCFLATEQVDEGILSRVSEGFQRSLAAPMKIVRMKSHGGGRGGKKAGSKDASGRVLRLQFQRGPFVAVVMALCQYYGAISRRE